MEHLPLKKINDEVYTATEPIVRLDHRAIEFTRECALRNKRGRARICAHRNPEANLHEMIIAITSASYVRPHRHRGKSESFHVVEGDADVVIFSNEGTVEDVVELGSGANFYYRLDTPRYHTVLPGSPVLVIHETTNGPFDPTQTDWADFAPAEGSPEAANYSTRLRQAVEAWKK
jgi:cupin fold WbuC family metalloprotein